MNPHQHAPNPGLSRREFLSRSAHGVGAMALWHLLARDGLAAPGAQAATFPNFPPKAKRVIFIFMAGGPSHLDLFDPKPGMAALHGQPMPESLTPNVALLEEIARKTGGQVVAAEELAKFASRLPQLRAPVMETWSYPAWHTPLMFAFALACLLTEWGLRRWKGMP